MASGVKYQIFISSTQRDLREERDAATKAILEMGHIPVGMEMFSAGDADQWKTIKAHIGSSDYYIVLVGHMYGSMARGISYTEKEYNYAVKNGIPTIGFVIDESARWPGDRIESDENKREKLRAFKEKVKKKMVSFWSSTDDLSKQVALSLTKEMLKQPRTGWIPASKAVDPETATEIGRLRQENVELRKSLHESQSGSTGLHRSRDRVWGVADGLFKSVGDVLNERENLAKSHGKVSNVHNHRQQLRAALERIRFDIDGGYFDQFSGDFGLIQSNIVSRFMDYAPMCGKEIELLSNYAL